MRRFISLEFSCILYTISVAPIIVINVIIVIIVVIPQIQAAPGPGFVGADLGPEIGGPGVLLAGIIPVIDLILQSE